VIFGRRRPRIGRTGGFAGRNDQRRFMRDMQRGGILNAIVGLFMFRITRMISGCLFFIVIIAVILVIAFIAN
jgi:hypothetical protein